MSLATPEKIRTLQRKLYRKAKAEPAFRFYLLYDKICRDDILEHAYALARTNGGAPGVDRESFAAIEAAGLEEWLAGIRKDLVARTYRPAPVRRGVNPKPRRGGRPPGLPPNAGPGRDRRDQGGACPAVPRLHRCGGRRSVEVFRHDPASRVDAVGGAPHRRPARAAADQAVAQSPGRGAWRRREAAHDGREGQSVWHAAGRRDQSTARQSLHEPLLEALAAYRTGRDLPRPRHRLCRRLRDPEPWPSRRGSGLDAAGDDAARARPQRGEDRRPECPARALRFPWLRVRPAPLPEGWPLVSGGEPLEEERAAAQVEGQRSAGARQHERLARGARPAQPPVAGLVGVLRLWHPPAGVPGDRQPRLRRVRRFLVRRHKVPSHGTNRFPRETVFGALGVLHLRRVHLGPPPCALR